MESYDSYSSPGTRVTKSQLEIRFCVCTEICVEAVVKNQSITVKLGI